MAKNNNKTLIIILIVLGAVLALLQLNTRKKESTLKRDLVDIDTARVTAIYLYPQSEKGEELEFYKTDKGWHIKEGEREGLWKSLRCVTCWRRCCVSGHSNWQRWGKIPGLSTMSAIRWPHA